MTEADPSPVVRTEPNLPEARQAATSEVLATVRSGHVRVPSSDGTTTFIDAAALAVLFAHEAVWCDGPAEGDGTSPASRGAVLLSVNCSDVFAWGVSESEPLPFDELEDLYGHWLKDRRHGADVWCMVRRREMPQRPVEEAIRKAGVWDLDALRVERGLRPNHYDGVSGALARHKYGAYSEWAEGVGRPVLPYDRHWWTGWRDYEAANPGWRTSEWEAEDARLVLEFKRGSGYPPED